jgi:two-component system chemotaxis response regulator CheY
MQQITIPTYKNNVKMQAPTKLRNKRILIVDDAASIRMLIQALLLDAGYKKVTQVEDGKYALQHLKKSHTDLIICDWNMPGMSGLELFNQMGKDPELHNIGFIMLTSSAGGEKVKEAINCGVTSYILKPFKPDALLQNVAKCLAEIPDGRQSL